MHSSAGVACTRQQLRVMALQFARMAQLKGPTSGKCPKDVRHRGHFDGLNGDMLL